MENKHVLSEAILLQASDSLENSLETSQNNQLKEFQYDRQIISWTTILRKQ